MKRSECVHELVEWLWDYYDDDVISDRLDTACGERQIWGIAEIIADYLEEAEDYE